MNAKLILTLIAVPALSPAVNADEIILKDGSKIVGQVTSVNEGKMTVKTEFAGDLEIETENVKGITTAEPVNVQLESGDKVFGKMTYDANGQKVTSDALGVKQVGEKDVKAVWQKDGISPEAAAAQAKYEAARAKWTLKLQLGVNGETGNNERVSFLGAARAKRTTDADRLELYFQGRYARENGVDTTKEFIGGANLEVDLSDRLYVYGRVEAENDKFEDLDLRATATAGLGYFLIKEDDHEWKVRGGAGVQYQSFTSGGDQTDGIGELGHDYMVEIAPWLTYTHAISFYVPFGHLDEWRLVMDNAAEIPLGDESEAWKLRLGMQNKYNSRPRDGVDRLDTFYYVALVLDLK